MYETAHNPLPTSPSHLDQALTVLRLGVAQSARDLFAAYGIDFRATLPAETPPPPETELLEAAYFSVAGFGGPHFSGFLAFGATENLLRRSNHTSSSSVDWMAELANQFLGRIKNQMLRQGIPLHRVPPAVVQGTAASLSFSRTGPPLLALSDEEDTVFIWVASEPSTEEMNAAPEPRSDVLAEGGMLLF